MSGAGPVTVATHPDDHPYLRHTRARQPDPSVRWVELGDGFWDVPTLVAAGVEVAHLHFGFELRTPAQLGDWVRAARAAGIRVAHTVHDLENPHLVDQRPFDALLDVLIPGSDGLFTLTDGAAAYVARRWSRRATVLAHPHLHPLPLPARPCAPWGDTVVVVQLGSLRANLDPGVVEDAVAATADRPRCVTRLHVRSDAWRSAPVSQRARIEAIAAPRHVELVVEPRPTETQLARRLCSAAAVVLPYGWCTHSGFVELARDCGAVAVAPPVGWLHEQGAVALDALSGAVDGALDGRHQVTTRSRAEERDHVAAVLSSWYRRTGGPDPAPVPAAGGHP